MQVTSLTKIRHERVGQDWILSVEATSGTSTFKTSADPYEIKIKKLASGNFEVDVIKLTATSPKGYWMETQFTSERDPSFSFEEIDFDGQTVAAIRVGMDDVILHAKFYDVPVTGTLQEVYLYCLTKASKTVYHIGHLKK